MFNKRGPKCWGGGANVGGLGLNLPLTATDNSDKKLISPKPQLKPLVLAIIYIIITASYLPNVV